MDIYHPQPLPARVAALLRALDAPPRLIAHLTLVHDAAAQILGAVRQRWPQLECDDQAVLFGAATHDIGKVEHPQELAGPGSRHEEAGVFLLWKLGVSTWLAHFAWSHGQWRTVPRPLLEDLLVALADTVWCGGRDVDLEHLVAGVIGEALRSDRWAIFAELDMLLEPIAALGEQRLAWQMRFPILER
jgi:HD domain